MNDWLAFGIIMIPPAVIILLFLWRFYPSPPFLMVIK